MKKNEEVLLFNNVFKTYKQPGFLKSEKKQALSGVSFSVYKNEIVALLGLNGAGKTTIIKSIFSLVKPDSGEISLFSGSLAEDAKLRLGYVPEFPYFYPHMRAQEALFYYGRLSMADNDFLNIRVYEILKKVGLQKNAADKCSSFSKGMLQRLAFAQAILHNPDFIVMDEPASGLDPLAIKDFRNLIIELNKEGKTIFLSSHSISEVEKICHRALVIKNGKITASFDRSQWEKSPGLLEEKFISAIDTPDTSSSHAERKQ